MTNQQRQAAEELMSSWSTFDTLVAELCDSLDSNGLSMFKRAIDTTICDSVDNVLGELARCETLVLA